MELNVTFRHMNPSEPIRQHIELRIEKLKKYLLKPESAHIVLKSEKFRRMAEISLTDNGNRITAIEESPDMYQSIDGALAKIEAQLRKYKEKTQSHKS
jgi:putative sigma-54 modulation protein